MGRFDIRNIAGTVPMDEILNGIAGSNMRGDPFNRRIYFVGSTIVKLVK